LDLLGPPGDGDQPGETKMKKFKIRVKLNVAESLRRGYAVANGFLDYVDIDVPNDISQEDRNLIADHLRPMVDSCFINVPWSWEMYRQHGHPKVNEPTISGVIELIKFASAAAARNEEFRQGAEGKFQSR
jgi:hypothetical protein